MCHTDGTLTLFIHKLELLASGAQYFVTKHLRVSEMVTKSMYATPADDYLLPKHVANFTLLNILLCFD